jgi:uncharacterized membrane protein (DUF106 family)
MTEDMNKVGEDSILKGKKGGSFLPLVVVMILILVIPICWDRIDWIKSSVHSALDPSAGALLRWDFTIGMIIIVFIITLITTLIQKYATDQKALRELRHEQKLLQEEMKKYRDNPEKISELSKKQMEVIPKTFKLTSRATLFTIVPFLLFYRWFSDFFVTIGEPKFFGFLNWFWFYLIFAIIFSSIFRKVLKVV